LTSSMVYKWYWSRNPTNSLHKASMSTTATYTKESPPSTPPLYWQPKLSSCNAESNRETNHTWRRIVSLLPRPQAPLPWQGSTEHAVLSSFLVHQKRRRSRRFEVHVRTKDSAIPQEAFPGSSNAISYHRRG
jgi:hypothetical protein